MKRVKDRSKSNRYGKTSEYYKIIREITKIGKIITKQRKNWKCLGKWKQNKIEKAKDKTLYKKRNTFHKKIGKFRKIANIRKEGKAGKAKTYR